MVLMNILAGEEERLRCRNEPVDNGRTCGGWTG